MLASRNKAQNEQFNDGVINVLEAEDGIIKKNSIYEISFGKADIWMTKDLWSKMYLGIR